MIARYNNVSLLFGVPGLVIQMFGWWKRTQGDEGLGLLISLAGTVLLFVGLGYYAKAKGRTPVWCLMGLLSLIGFIVLGALPDLAKDGKGPS